MTDELTADEWRANRDRPAWVRANADRIEEVGDFDVPTSLAAIPDWVDRYKGSITRAAGGEGEDAAGADTEETVKPEEEE